ncbi:hypothetical protein BCR43DRAFT_487206 [Syncephalastrum racemosum]|uniref:DH domain-containing protein n=1 Tax=Syncephalastrum racemosum TaxID=13706 RepID=A0A1X2HQI0_SYNRA|nr:hypothetical protein BCR43DRAFT_487206 [Syncephalastrum racemosum]
MTKDFFIGSPTDASSCSENKDLDLTDHPLPISSDRAAATPDENGIVSHDVDLKAIKHRSLGKHGSPRLTHSSLTLATSNSSLTGSHTSFISMVDVSHEGNAFKERSRRKKAEIEAAASVTLAAARAARSTSQSPATDLSGTARIPCFSSITDDDHTRTACQPISFAEAERVHTGRRSGHSSSTKAKPALPPSPPPSSKDDLCKGHFLDQQGRDPIAAQDKNQTEQDVAGALLGSIANDAKRNIRLHQQLHRSPAIAIKKDQGDSASAFRYRKEMKQMAVVNELVETEKNYIHDLGILCNHFMIAILENTAVLSEQERSVLVRNIFEVQEFHDRFYNALMTAAGMRYQEDGGKYPAGSRLSQIARCFCDWSSGFKIYYHYCIQQEDASQMYRRLQQSNNQFSNLINQLHALHRSSTTDISDTKINKLTFDDYFIMPLQRIFRYSLLLQSIIKTAESGTDEYELLREAERRMTGICRHLNEAKERMEAELKTKLFVERLGSDWATSRKFYSMFGCSQLIGTLDVQPLWDGQRAKRYGCSLFNTYIIIAKGRKHNVYEPRFYFPLRLVELTDVASSTGDPSLSWILGCHDYQLEFTASTAQEKALWISCLKNTIETSKCSEEALKQSTALESVFGHTFNEGRVPLSSSSTLVGSYGGSLYNLFGRSDSGSGAKRGNGSRVGMFPTNNSGGSRPASPGTACSSPCLDEELPGHSAHKSYTPSISSRHQQASFGDLRGFIASTVSDRWSQHKFHQYNGYRAAVDAKFLDVCLTPVLTSRTQTDRQSQYETWKRSRMTKSVSYQPLSLSEQDETTSAAPGIDQPAAPTRTHISSVSRKTSLPARLSDPTKSDTREQQGSQTLSARQRPHAFPETEQQRTSQQTHGLPNTQSMIYRLSRHGSLKKEQEQKGEPNEVIDNHKERKTKPMPPSPSQQQLQDLQQQLPRSLSTASMSFGFARSSSRFFGKISDTFSKLGTPQKACRNTTLHCDIPKGALRQDSHHKYKSGDERLSQKKKRDQAKKPPPLIIPCPPKAAGSSR